jgi:hypothetical protein
MAHTDRDSERWHREDHHRNKCPNAWRNRAAYGDFRKRPCDFCRTEPDYYPYHWWYSLDGKRHWNREQRRAERVKAKQALRECRDYDALIIGYHRPYWD